MFLDPAKTPGFKRTLFNAIVAPRPIGWISTINGNGQVNLAPFSHFNLVSTAPPVVMFSCNAPADRHEKDTVTNIRETGEFVTNLVTWNLREPMNMSSIDAPYGTDEFELAGLEKAPSVLVKPPRVAASPASMECRLLRILDIEPTGPGETFSRVVFGRVVGVHLDERFVGADGRFDTVLAEPLTRLDGNRYATVGRLDELGRPSPRNN
ncbi:flavin reductase family protein [Paraburkholderia susongensis]|uniref:NADH-FMN oxidoreductase RutF, flavin reductase (DIM6/NTAB) family n=1 Tax=Paraburkholderia susongensis TaxID=1515439 RepID=A0A1X7KZA6_9BURK|nr:flavin reductase family protein [Paraburkholderia susongensis]SMG46564.1 NADH-FMN oxidoreductase RutF, flavin reductase (DIM6/NTAB) family [Paraburkholderia susongensis]